MGGVKYRQGITERTDVYMGYNILKERGVLLLTSLMFISMLVNEDFLFFGKNFMLFIYYCL